MRGATTYCGDGVAAALHFNPRTPCGVRLQELRNVLMRRVISIHAPLAGCDWSPMSFSSPKRQFQSTHPLRGATGQQLIVAVVFGISIHAPLAGCDTRALRRFVKISISIHAPLAGCDDCAHIGHREDGYFNPRTPCGVRPYADKKSAPPGYFNPRTPCGVRLFLGRELRIAGNFNPRTPCGVRHNLAAVFGNGSSISIHAPLAGCDWNLV